MAETQRSGISAVLRSEEQELLAEWINSQLATPSLQKGLVRESDVRKQSHDFLRSLRDAIQSGDGDITSAHWSPVRGILANISAERARSGVSPADTAMFIFSLKEPLFQRLRGYAESADKLALDVWQASTLLDRLGLYTTEVYGKSREEIIARQQQDMLELSTPVVRLWEGVLALPLIGTLDSARTQVVMESLLQKIVDTGAAIAIIDITGVPMVDTLVAQHLLKTVAAARLMGADCIISGIRPQIAQTIIHLGVEMSTVTTKATMADAFAVALQRSRLVVTRVEGA